jgi:putative addiction module killer protein
MSIEVGFLEISSGKCPYVEWEKRLEKSIRAAIRVRINRLRIGNFGDCKTIKGSTGLYELRIHWGPGYRLYFGRVKDSLVIILCGGDKGTQLRDIQKAKEYWQLYKGSFKDGKYGKSKEL